VTPDEIAKHLEPSLYGWDVIEATADRSYLTITCESDIGNGDTMVFRLHVTDVEFVPGPPTREDFLPDRIEPGDDDVP
jgi:hypothetical protein